MCAHMLVCGWRTSVTIPQVLATLFLEAGSLIGLRLTNRARLADQTPVFCLCLLSAAPRALVLVPSWLLGSSEVEHIKWAFVFLA